MSSKCGFEFSIHNIMSRSFSSSFQISTTSHYSECRLYISLSILVAKLVWKQDLGIRRVPLLSNNMDTLGVFLIKIHTYVHITWSSPLSSKLNIKHQSHCASLLREYSTIQTCFFVIITNVITEFWASSRKADWRRCRWLKFWLHTQDSSVNCSGEQRKALSYASIASSVDVSSSLQVSFCFLIHSLLSVVHSFMSGIRLFWNAREQWGHTSLSVMIKNLMTWHSISA